MSAQMTELYDFVNENGIVLPNTTSIRDRVVEDLKSVFGRTLDATPETATGRLVEFLAIAFSSVLRVNATNANQLDLNRATGRYLDGHGSLYSLPRKGRSKSRVLVDFVGAANLVIGAGLIVSDEDTGSRFMLESDVTLNSEGLGSGYMSCTEYGPVECKVGKLTVIETAVIGLNSASNGADATVGSLVETDEEYRLRIKASLGTGVGFLATIRNRINSLTGVQSSVVYENGDSRDRVINGVVVKGHSIFVCVDGGDEDEIARAIYETKDAGCGYTDTNVNVNDESGNSGVLVTKTIEDDHSGVSYDVVFYRPITYRPRIEVIVSRNLYTGEDLTADVAKVVTDFCGTLGIGRGFTAIDIGGAIMSAIPSVHVRDVTINGTGSFDPRGNCIAKPEVTDVIVSFNTKWGVPS